MVNQQHIPGHRISLINILAGVSNVDQGDHGSEAIGFLIEALELIERANESADPGQKDSYKLAARMFTEASHHEAGLTRDQILEFAEYTKGLASNNGDALETSMNAPPCRYTF
ncbi:MAG: hypothetical protein ABIH34_06365 [Nanoarchaeota archaeon]